MQPFAVRNAPSATADVFMIWLLTLVGAAGAASLHALDTSPALGARTKNAAGLLAAALVGLAMWLAGSPFACVLPAAWGAGFLLMWASTFEVGDNDMVWARVTASTLLVVLMGQFFQ